MRCIVCGKYSDAAIGEFCGTHYDGWRKSPEIKHIHMSEGARLADYVRRAQSEDRNGSLLRNQKQQ